MASHIRTHLIFGALPGFELAGSLEATFWQPRMDVYEIEDALLIQIEAPGLSLDDVELQFTPGELIVTGVRSRPPLPAPARASFVEMNYGPFRRRLKMPDDVRGDDISAKYEAGILLVTVPRHTRELPAPVRIAIK